MRSINFVVLGEQTIANDFGKKGTTTDLTLYDKKESDIIRTWVVPNGFPEKIQPLLQAINIAEYVIFYVASLDRYVGEQIIALNMLGKNDGIIGRIVFWGRTMPSPAMCEVAAHVHGLPYTGLGPRRGLWRAAACHVVGISTS